LTKNKINVINEKVLWAIFEKMNNKAEIS